MTFYAAFPRGPINRCPCAIASQDPFFSPATRYSSTVAWSSITSMTLRSFKRHWRVRFIFSLRTMPNTARRNHTVAFCSAATVCFRRCCNLTEFTRFFLGSLVRCFSSPLLENKKLRTTVLVRIRRNSRASYSPRQSCGRKCNVTRTLQRYSARTANECN